MKFADTGWWVAWVFPGDGRHQEALAMLNSLGPNEQVLSTNMVIGETWTFLRRKDSHRTAVGFLDRIASLQDLGRLKIDNIDEGTQDKAWTWLRRHDERVYSFVDATSFEVMRRHRLREALAFDHDFAAAGFIEVQP